MNNESFEEFQQIVWEQGRLHFRSMPWRDSPTLYYVLVSELMLQQTQVSRVLPKFIDFIQKFPDSESLAEASLADVLRAWQGLGYNRRARFLHDAAKQIIQTKEPLSLASLQCLPGVGINTAGAIMNYVYEQPTPFVETNIRTVYFHHFFRGSETVRDKEIYQCVRDTLDYEQPREWFWALMDYGSYLKSRGLGQLDKSHHYKKQAPLKGSVREIRGKIITCLQQGPQKRYQLEQAMVVDERLDVALEGLQRDGLISVTNGQYHLTK